ncbi:hypothetical protein ACWD6N_12210 [Micromonospora sp. NPDC005163]
MTVFAFGGGVHVAMVEAKAVLPLPPLPDAELVDVAEGDRIQELELLRIWGPPAVVAAALDALGAHLEELIPEIGALYTHDAAPQDGG